MEEFKQAPATLDKGSLAEAAVAGPRGLSGKSTSKGFPIKSDSLEEGEFRSSASSDSEEACQSSELLASKFHFLVQETEDLIRAIYASEQIQDMVKSYLARDRLYNGLAHVSHKVFPVHQRVKDIILREWKTPENKLVFARSLKCRFPFDADSAGFRNKCPKLDAAVAMVSNRLGLSFEDMGFLKD